jgi:hypothetical protein
MHPKRGNHSRRKRKKPWKKHGGNSPGIVAGPQNIGYNLNRGEAGIKARRKIRKVTGKRAGKSCAPG